LRQVLDFAEKIELIPKGSNPATQFELGAPPPRNKVWEADDEAALSPQPTSSAALHSPWRSSWRSTPASGKAT
jgi:hypothetical protein